MNLPFGLPVIREVSVKKRDLSMDTRAQYERKLVEYGDTLENYKKLIVVYSGKLEDHEKADMNNQLSEVQTALDFTYLKEQEDKTIQILEEIKAGTINKTSSQIESLSSTISEINLKLEGLDRNVVNRVSELLLELQKQTVVQNKQLQTEQMMGIEKLTKTVKKGHRMLGIILALYALGLGGLIFLILYVMEIIPF